jgi:hypothetical protein
VTFRTVSLFVPTLGTVAGFTLACEGITVAIEWLATEVWHRWSYAADMPTLPLVGTGLVPLLQWLVLPPLVVGLVCRQLRGGQP